MTEPSITKIVGIAGLPRSGKDTLAQVFIDNGFFGVSLGDIIRDESKVRHADTPDPISVANMTETSNWLRASKGADFALVEALNRYQLALGSGKVFKGLVVWSVRAPIEVDFILNHSGQLIWLEATDKTRLERAQGSRREGEPEWTLEKLKAQEALQWVPQPDIPKESQMNIAYVKEKSTQKFLNETSDIEEFKARSQKLVQELL